MAQRLTTERSLPEGLSDDRLARSKAAEPYSIALYYFIAAAAWILLSDRVLALFVTDVQAMAWLQSLKGGAFITCSSLLIGALSVRQHRLRKREEQERRRVIEASEARFRSLVQNGGDVIRLLDRDGAIVYESPSIARVLGYEPKKHSARHALDRIHPDDALRVTEELAAAMNSGQGVSTYRVRHADGSWRWFESVGVNLFDDPNVGGFVVNSRDITERKQAEEAVREAQSFSEAIIDSFPGLFYVLDESGRYVKWNRNQARILAYSDEEIAELNPLDLFEGDDRSRVANGIAEGFERGFATVEAVLVTKTGEKIPYYLTGKRVHMNGERLLVGAGVDLSEIRAAHAKIENLNRELEERLRRVTTLFEIDKAITGFGDLEMTLELILTQITERLEVNAATVLLYTPSSEALHFGVSKGFRRPPQRSANLLRNGDPAGRAALERRRVVMDAEEFPEDFLSARQMQRDDFDFYIAAPLITKGKLLGVLELFERSAAHRSDDWFAFVGALATQVAIAVDGASMIERLEQSNHELRLAYDTTIEGWARALDLKDEETEGHSRRVTELTVRLAKHMGMSEEDLLHVRRGALLHDIGKMGVPDSILLKPGKLDENEWETMKQHTTYAFDLLSPIPFLRSAMDIPYCHHEKWDGSGYPRGLKGHQIPLAARIFSLVDVYDALTSDRPYREAWSEQRALDFIREQAGRHFDPDIAAIFLELIGASSSASSPDAGTRIRNLPSHLGEDAHRHLERAGVEAVPLQAHAHAHDSPS